MTRIPALIPLLIAAALFGSSAGAQVWDRPNILLFIADDMTWSGAYPNQAHAYENTALAQVYQLDLI